MKKFLSILLTLVMALTLMTACNSSNDPDQADTTDNSKKEENASDNTSDNGDLIEIGVIQYVEHAALDAANKGFVDELEASGLNVKIDQQNAQGEQATCETIATKFEADQKDLVYAIATPAAQAIAGKTSEIPIIFSAVTDAVEGELVEDNENPGGNVTGASDLTPVTEQIDLLQQILPDAKKVGILYCAAEANSIVQADMAKEAIDKVGLEWEEYTVSSSNEIQSVVESMVGKVDVLYAPTDNMIANGMTTVSMIATEGGLPTIVGENGMVEAGGLATYGIDYYELGRLAAKQAIEILKGEGEPASMPVEHLKAEECEFSYNEETAKDLGIEIPADLLD